MAPEHLLQIAISLADANTGRPRRADLCRAVSTTYYALFHCLVRTCADRLAGSSGTDVTTGTTVRFAPTEEAPSMISVAVRDAVDAVRPLGLGRRRCAKRRRLLRHRVRGRWPRHRQSAGEPQPQPSRAVRALRGSAVTLNALMGYASRV